VLLLMLRYIGLQNANSAGILWPVPIGLPIQNSRWCRRFDNDWQLTNNAI